MPGAQSYLLTGYGPIETAWMRDFLNLFKRERVNIRKVVLLKDGNPERFSMIEIQFVVQPEQDAFMDRLALHLDKLAWTEKTLAPV